MFNRFLATGFILVCVLGAPAYGASLASSANTYLSIALNDTYRIGDEWGKHIPSAEELAQNEVLNRAVNATAHLGSATAFYLGTFNGSHILATNHHVCETADACVGSYAKFTHADVDAKVELFLGTWPEVDLALMTIDLDEEDEAKMEAYAKNFNFNANIYPGQKLLTVGHGVANNPIQKLVVNYDTDCQVFSGYNEFRLMADPDELNPAPYKAWSFANGCDVSHGDSGSAMVDRENGEVVGIIWTGRIPKSETVQDSEFLAPLVGKDNDVIWKELSYSVPAQKIREFLNKKLEDGEFGEDAARLLNAVLAN